jgi:hypothetical protein
MSAPEDRSSVSVWSTSAVPALVSEVTVKVPVGGVRSGSGTRPLCDCAPLRVPLKGTTTTRTSVPTFAVVCAVQEGAVTPLALSSVVPAELTSLTV